MRTNIVLDDELLERAIELSGLKSKRAAVHEALRVYVDLREQAKIRELRGKYRWNGDLEESRQSRFHDSC